MAHCKRILVVEDNDDIRDLLVQVLDEEGYEVDCAENGKEALEKLAARPSDPSLVLLDLMMPTMNGWEFLEARKKDPTLAIHKIVTMSAVRATVSLNDSTPL
jgi:CheY-like chemotaxis protein